IAAEQNRHTRLVRRLQYLAHSLNSSTAAKKALGRIAIHRIGIDVVFVQGTGGSSLDLGPGHYTQTSLPAEGGTVGLAGHRTTYGAWFRHIDDLRRGDEIVLTMPYGRFTYVVQGHRIVPGSRRPEHPARAGDGLLRTADGQGREGLPEEPPPPGGGPGGTGNAQGAPRRTPLAPASGGGAHGIDRDERVGMRRRRAARERASR